MQEAGINELNIGMKLGGYHQERYQSQIAQLKNAVKPQNMYSTDPQRS